MFVARRGELLRRADCSLELGDDFKQVSDQPDICDLEYRCFAVLVDRDDSPCILDPGEMLDGTRDADCNVQFGSDDLTGLTDLHFVRHLARIDCGPRGANTRAQRVRQLVNQVEILRATEGPAA